MRNPKPDTLPRTPLFWGHNPTARRLQRQIADGCTGRRQAGVNTP